MLAAGGKHELQHELSEAARRVWWWRSWWWRGGEPVPPAVPRGGVHRHVRCQRMYSRKRKGAIPTSLYFKIYY